MLTREVSAAPPTWIARALLIWVNTSHGQKRDAPIVKQLEDYGLPCLLFTETDSALDGALCPRPRRPSVAGQATPSARKALVAAQAAAR